MWRSVRPWGEGEGEGGGGSDESMAAEGEVATAAAAAAAAARAAGSMVARLAGWEEAATDSAAAAAAAAAGRRELLRAWARLYSAPSGYLPTWDEAGGLSKRSTRPTLHSDGPSPRVVCKYERSS